MRNPHGLAGVMILACSSLFGCGTPTTFQCDPMCPAGFTCTQAGCVADNPQSLDMSASPADMIDKCGGQCAGATPKCNPNGLCVPCLADADCPQGNVCQSVGAGSACVPGCKDDSRCGGALKCCTGHCVDTTVDAQNCGACSKPCTANHSDVTCKAGACVLGSCAPGWGDCNAKPDDGCEANLHSDPMNCTMCGMACTIKNAITGCADGCYLSSCKFGFDDCNNMAMDGCEKDVSADPANCGACGNACGAPAHATTKCINAACQLTSCVQGYSDCDGDPKTGCEVATGTDAKNCGACNNACPNGQVCINSSCTCNNCSFPNAKSQCINGVCTFLQCLPGFGDCDHNSGNGCEVNLNSDKSNCTACGVACPQGQACVNGSCAMCNGNVLVIGDDQAAANQTLVNAINAAGLVATLVPNGTGPNTGYTGNPSAANYGAVVILIGNNYGSDLPAAGQMNILNAVNSGVGLVTSEWFAYEISTQHYLTLTPFLLLQRTSGTTMNLTYTMTVNHPVWNGLPMSFKTTNSMGANSGNTLMNGGMGIASCAECAGGGVVVRDNGGGRVVQHSFASDYSTGGPLAWGNDPNLTTLMINSIKWAARCM